MVKALSFETEIHDAMVALDLALKGADAADALLETHAKGEGRLATINFPHQEGLFREAASLMEQWQSRARKLLTDLDHATAAAHLHYQQLFDPSAHEQERAPLYRRMTQARTTPETIASELKALLAASVSLEQTLKGLRPLILRRHKRCEGHLVRLVERRRHLDFTIEEAQRHADALSPKINARLQRIGTVINAERLDAIEEEHSALVAEQQALIAKEAGLAPERQTLRQLVSIYEGFVESLNAQARVLNLMKAKLEIDIEQRVGLLKAVLASSRALPGELPPAVAGLIQTYDANPVSGYKLEERKARADAAFIRKPHRDRTEAPAADPGGTPAEAAAEAK